jgi:hypothetical protein
VFLTRVFQSGAFTQKNKFVLVGRIKSKSCKCRVCRLKLGFAFRHTGLASYFANLGISYDYQSVKRVRHFLHECPPFPLGDASTIFQLIAKLS